MSNCVQIAFTRHLGGNWQKCPTLCMDSGWDCVWSDCYWQTRAVVAIWGLTWSGLVKGYGVKGETLQVKLNNRFYPWYLPENTCNKTFWWTMRTKILCFFHTIMKMIQIIPVIHTVMCLLDFSGLNSSKSGRHLYISQNLIVTKGQISSNYPNVLIKFKNLTQTWLFFHFIASI